VDDFSRGHIAQQFFNERIVLGVQLQLRDAQLEPLQQSHVFPETHTEDTFLVNVENLLFKCTSNSDSKALLFCKPNIYIALVLVKFS